MHKWLSLHWHILFSQRVSSVWGRCCHAHDVKWINKYVQIIHMYMTTYKHKQTLLSFRHILSILSEISQEIVRIVYLSGWVFVILVPLCIQTCNLHNNNKKNSPRFIWLDSSEKGQNIELLGNALNISYICTWQHLKY